MKLSRLFQSFNPDLHGYLTPIEFKEDTEDHQEEEYHQLVDSDTGIKDLSQNHMSSGQARPSNARHAKFMGWRTDSSTMHL